MCTNNRKEERKTNKNLICTERGKETHIHSVYTGLYKNQSTFSLRTHSFIHTELEKKSFCESQIKACTEWLDILSPSF